MELSALQALLSIHEEGSFSAASERLNISQPAISKRIRVLEEQLNTKLFDRAGRQMQLTEAGLALLPSARKILYEVQEAKQVVSQLRHEVQGSLALACSHHIGIHRLPPALKAFRQQYPEVGIQLEFLSSEEAQKALLSRRLDLAFITLPTQISSPFIGQCLWQDELGFAASHDHPLAMRPSLRLNELAYSDNLLPDASTETFKVAEKLFQQHRLPLHASMAVNYIETLRTLAGAGLGWTLLPLSLITYPLVRLPVECEPLSRRLGYLQLKQRSLPTTARAFLTNLGLPPLMPPEGQSDRQGHQQAK